VKRDEREKSDRKLLNFGHTLGHAIEQYYSMPHGHAVAIGMVFASRISQHFGLISDADVYRLIKLLEAYHLPVSFPWNHEVIAPMILQDKKRKGDQIQFVVLNGLGHAFTKDIDLHVFQELLKVYSQ
jgi:3-dehydroquinate synthase